MPPQIAVNAGDIIRALDPAVGGISFFNGVGDPFHGPSGNGLTGNSLTSLGGIRGYIGPPGAYDDNDGSYRIRLGINEIPTQPTEVPEPGNLALLLIGLTSLWFGRRRISK